jgi:sec-independent protein translocase protein TatA
MIGDLFDSPWKILIIALVIIVLFGSRKLPSAARSLGQSMRILKREVQSLHEDEPASPATQAAQAAQVAPAVLAPLQQSPTPLPDAQAQIEGLQAQINNLQQQTVAANGRGSGGHRADSLTRGPEEMG